MMIGAGALAGAGLVLWGAGKLGAAAIRAIEEDADRESRAWEADREREIREIARQIEAIRRPAADGAADAAAGLEEVFARARESALALTPPAGARSSPEAAAFGPDSPEDRASASAARLGALLELLEGIDRGEARRLRGLAEGLPAGNPLRPDRAAALELEFKLALGAASKAPAADPAVLAEDLWRRGELAKAARALEDSLDAPGTELASELRLAAAGAAAVREEAFSRLMGRYSQRLRRESLKASLASVPGLGAAALANGEELNRILVAETVSAALREKGYAMYGPDGSRMDAPSGRTYLDAGLGAGYFVMIDPNGTGGATLRIVRAVEDDRELEAASGYQRAKDREASEKWCAGIEDMKRLVEGCGMVSGLSVTKGPEEGIACLVNPALARLSAASGEGKRGKASVGTAMASPPNEG
jgi:hypothetical protein